MHEGKHVCIAISLHPENSVSRWKQLSFAVGFNPFPKLFLSLLLEFNCLNVAFNKTNKLSVGRLLALVLCWRVLSTKEKFLSSFTVCLKLKAFSD